jgi:ATP-dependent protease ClpP protease subunit
MNKTWYAVTNQTTDSADVEIYDEIGGWGVSAKEFIKGLQALSGKHLNLRINSPGGSIVDGQAIISALKRHTGGFTAWVDGLAASMASVIACAAEKCYMADGAMMMIHRASTVSMGDASDLRKDADILEKFERGLLSVYQQKTGMDEGQLKEMLAQETWMDSLEAVALGFADGITDAPVAMASLTQGEMRARFDTFRSKSMKNTPANNEELPESPEEEAAQVAAASADSTAVETPVIEETPSEEPAVADETIEEETSESSEAPAESSEAPVDGAGVADAAALATAATSIAAKFSDLTARAEMAEARATALEARARVAEEALLNLERSLGVAPSVATARVEPPAAAVMTMTLGEFRSLPHGERSAFIRKGGKIQD